MGRHLHEKNKSIYDVIRKYNLSASETSLRTYVSNIEKLYHDLDKDIDNSNYKVFEDVDKVLNLLDEQDISINTYKNKLSSIITYLLANGVDKKIVSKYSEKVDALSAKIDRTQNKMQWNEKETKNKEDINLLKDYIQNMKDKLPATINKYDDLYKYMKVIAGGFHLEYPLRNELSDAKIYTKADYDKLSKTDPDVNYIIINPKNSTCDIILNKYKTSKTYKTIEFEVDDKDLCALFIKYYNGLKKVLYEDDFKNRWFLIKHDMSKLSRNEYTKFMQRVFEGTGKSISTSLIRKIVLSNLYPVEKMKKLSAIMGHSIKTAISDYVKN
jgi:hypothetical protein